MNLKKKNFSQFGKTGLTFFRLEVGTAALAGVNMVNAAHYTRPTDLEIKKFIEFALEIINVSETNMLMVDTSSQYGESEYRLGHFINKHPNALKKMYISTKWGLKFKPEDFCVQDYSLKNLNASLETSLKHLRKIDLLYIHTNPGTSPEQLNTILNKNSEILDRLKEIRKNSYGGVRHIGISLSSEKNLDFLIENKNLLDDFDVLQIDANIFLKRPDLARLVYSLGIGTVLNSVYRKGNKQLRATKEGLNDIYCKILDSHKDAIILTGTKDIGHLKDNVDYVRNWNTQTSLQINYSHQYPIPVKDEDILRGLETYFGRMCLKSEKNLNTKAKTAVSGKIIDIVESITDVFVGSLKTRLGPAPDKNQRKILSDRVKYYVSRNLVIDTILTWGPKKFFSGKEESNVDLSEAVSLERLMNISEKIRSYYSPGVFFTIFMEDFEGKFIEGAHLSNIFDSYISGFENLVRVLDMDDILRVVRTHDLLRVHYDIHSIVDRLDENYNKLKKYWYESEVKGIEGSEIYDSYKQIEKLGWYGKIGNDTRNYYLGRLNNILGETKTSKEKTDMTIRLLACVLIHRQYNIFRINKDIEPVKLSFLKISAGPKRLMDGRVDIRTIPTNVSKKHIAPWASKGCLRIKNDQVLPLLKRWRELLDKSCTPIQGKITFERAHRKICFDTSFVAETKT